MEAIGKREGVEGESGDPGAQKTRVAGKLTENQWETGYVEDIERLGEVVAASGAGSEALVPLRSASVDGAATS